MKLYKITLLLGLCMGMSSCVDLTQTPDGFLTEEEYFKTKGAAIKAADGLYISMWNSNYGFNSRMMRLNAGAGDITSSPTKPNNALNYIVDLQPSLTSNNDDFAIIWKLFYNVVFDSNKIIKFTSTEQIDADPKVAIAVGEAYYMRALSYFYLVRLFGDVPMYLDNDNATARMPRTEVEKVYDEAILPSLMKAMELLDNNSRSKTSSNPNLWAAKALLADVYITMAGWPLNRGTEFYAKSAKESLDIIQSGKYSLTPKYEDLWKENLKTETNEHMFALHHSAAQKVPSQYGKSFYPSDFYPTAGWSDYYGNEEFFLAYPEDDRKNWNYMTDWASSEAGGDVVYYKDSKDGLPAISKYYDYNNGKPAASAQSNGLTAIYRYADVLLMYAEASNLATGSVNDMALDCLNKVQSRAHSALTTTRSSEEFDKAVFAERGWEFVAEFKRWFDLVRREKLAEARPNAYNGSLFKANNHYLYPIPYEQVQLTGWTNNPGY